MEFFEWSWQYDNWFGNWHFWLIVALFGVGDGLRDIARALTTKAAG